MSTFQDENKFESEAKINEIDIKPIDSSNETQRFAGKVSAEQEISASVARKRRNISKKRSESAHRTREVTPARDLVPETNIDDKIPKTPERKLRKTSSNNSSASSNSGNTPPDPKDSQEPKNGAKLRTKSMERPIGTKDTIAEPAENGAIKRLKEAPVVEEKLPGTTTPAKPAENGSMRRLKEAPVAEDKIAGTTTPAKPAENGSMRRLKEAPVIEEKLEGNTIPGKSAEYGAMKRLKEAPVVGDDSSNGNTEKGATSPDPKNGTKLRTKSMERPARTKDNSSDSATKPGENGTVKRLKEAPLPDEKSTGNPPPETKQLPNDTKVSKAKIDPKKTVPKEDTGTLTRPIKPISTDDKMTDVRKENMKTAAKIIEKVKKSEGGTQTPNVKIDAKETATTTTTPPFKEKSSEIEQTVFPENVGESETSPNELKPSENLKIPSEIKNLPSEAVEPVPTNSTDIGTRPAEEIKKPPREKPARMKRDKLIKKRSQSVPRPTTEDEDNQGSKLDLEVQKERLKKEQIELPMVDTSLSTISRPKPIRKGKEIIPIAPEVVLAPTKDLVEDFKQAQVLSAKLEVRFNPSSSESSVESSESSQSGQARRRVGVGKPYAPAAQQYLERRRLEKQLSASKEEETKVPEAPKKRWIGPKQIREHWKMFKIDHQEECFRIKNLRNRCLNEIGLLMIFCGLGGLIFKFTEGALENFYKCGVKRVKRDFIDLLWIKSHNLREEDWKALARVRLRDFEEQLHTAHEAGVQSYSGQRSWSFLNGIVYSLTVVTTIGYGHMYPTTTTGRVLTIVYALIGIPLFLIILTDFGKLFTRAIKFLWAFVRRVYYTGTCRNARKTTAVKEVMKGAQMVYDLATFRRPSQFNNFDENDPNRPREILENQNQIVPHTADIEGQPDTPAPSNFEIDDEFNLPISVALTILVIYMFAGAVVYLYWEDWDFFASFYFVFISMSTIGFGDFVPRHPICMIVSIIYLVFGLALMSMCINVVQVKLSDTFRQASAKLGATIGLRVAEEDGSITTIPPPSVELPEVHAAVNNRSA